MSCTDIINLRYRPGSLGSLSNPERFNEQDYEQLKQYQLSWGYNFVDETFPPDSNALGDLGLSQRELDEVEWLRPDEIMKAQYMTKDPSFIVEGASRFDFGQGSVGNCWFLAAIASITFQKDLMAQVVPEQTFSDYAGIFHFRFWRFGKWVDVVIDDLLPTVNKQLLSVRHKTGNEFWVPLLEKAYAKVCGSYADMNYGLPSEAFKDFSGGVHMTYKLRESRAEDLWNALTRATACQSVIGCWTSPRGESSANTVAHTGLVDAHAYAVTAIREVMLDSFKVKLVRLMNPWGRQEWNGDWSDRSSWWNAVSKEDREKRHERNDGEFWMSLEDYCRYFANMDICCENPNFIDGDVTCQWTCMIYDGRWVAGRTAGGCLNYTTTFWKNPQYRITVKAQEDEKEGDENILLSLLQKPDQRNRKKMRYSAIGLTIYEVPAETPKGRLGASFFENNWPRKYSKVYTYDRELIELHYLKPGEYLIIPSTLRPNKTADFVLTVYSKAETDMEDHSEDRTEVPTPPAEGTNDMNQTHEMYKRYADQNGDLSGLQLQKLLNENFPHGSTKGFGLDTSRSMVALMDRPTERNGRMTFSEFLGLWNQLEYFTSIFHRTDVSTTGTLDSEELLKAVHAAGIEVDADLVSLLAMRYSASYDSITLVDYLTLILRLDCIAKIFKRHTKKGYMNVNWTEWLRISMYA